MLSLANAHEIYAYTKPTDMRKGCDGLSGMIRQDFHADPTDGSLFLFINRRRDRMKILHFDDGGFWLYPNVAEKGLCGKRFEDLQHAVLEVLACAEC